MSFNFVESINTPDANQQTKQYSDILDLYKTRDAVSYYECIKNVPVVPYYDYDFKYETEEEQEGNKIRDFKLAYRAISKVYYPKIRKDEAIIKKLLLSLDCSGKKVYYDNKS